MKIDHINQSQPSLVDVGTPKSSIEAQTKLSEASKILPNTQVASTYELTNEKNLFNQLSQTKQIWDTLMAELPLNVRDVIGDLLNSTLSLQFTKGFTALATGPKAASDQLFMYTKLTDAFSQFFAEYPEYSKGIIDFFNQFDSLGSNFVAEKSTGNEEFLALLDNRLKDLLATSKTPMEVKAFIHQLFGEVMFSSGQLLEDTAETGMGTFHLLQVFHLTQKLTDFSASGMLKNMAALLDQNSLIQGSSQDHGVFMFIPIYHSPDVLYPAYIHIYREKPKNSAKGESDEVWLRLCLLPQNMGPLEMVFHLDKGKQLNVKMIFSDDRAAFEFSKFVPEINQTFLDMSFEEGGVTVTTKSAGR